MQHEVESLLARERPDRARALAQRERRIELALTALVIAGAGGCIAAFGGPAPSLPALAIGILVVAVTSTVRLHAGGGSATGATLGVIPLLWLIPLPWVPAAVAAAFCLAATPAALAVRHPGWRVLTAGGDAAYVFAPVLVLLVLDGPTPVLIVHALAAQFAADAALSIGREWLGRGIRPELQLHVMAVVFGVDAALAPVGVAIGVAAADQPAIALVLVPLCGLLVVMARERNARLADAADEVAALESERERVDLALHRAGRTLGAGLEGLDVLELAVGTAVDALAADAGRARLAGEHDATVFGALPGQACAAHTSALLAAERGALSGRPEVVVEDSGWHAVAVPVQPVGAISVGRADRAFTPRERRLLAYLAAQAQVALERGELAERVVARQRLDPLVGLPDRRTLRDELHLAVERADRTESRLSALMLDVDGLRDVNEALGEDAGDDALRAIAGFVAERARLTDVAARYEEDTLVLILPGTSLEGAHMVAEDLRTGIGRLDVPAGTGAVRLTVSIGIAERTASTCSAEALLDAARCALVAAKDGGRNRTAPDPTKV
ncbi:GGDEF domain-containing protein [Solirubrobacter phytolaccae]|uniref:GGDEF domain-containing protein n=1 Tax=Solirubrobacter phytolaccae TaxID=1404360 RepID=A0A9X3N7D1_9ACTN|nr:GGDEF domain-containing protein [Solirubrobacter phytolaccae]MDA0181088.1 GGDEF domain-containing protein [Solirubrobacter phytolaccae]